MTDPILNRPSVAAGTLAADANQVKVAAPAGWIRERQHIGDGHYRWSEPFDPLVRAREDYDADTIRLSHRGEGEKQRARDRLSATADRPATGIK